jgi:hypothetical protein
VDGDLSLDIADDRLVLYAGGELAARLDAARAGVTSAALVELIRLALDAGGGAGLDLTSGERWLLEAQRVDLRLPRGRVVSLSLEMGLDFAEACLWWSERAAQASDSRTFYTVPPPEGPAS